MSDLYKNKYRIASARAQWWDYGLNAAYFITICTHNRTHFFGRIAQSQLIASPIGQMAHTYWQEIPQHFPFVRLDAFVVMPNHVHGILIIDKPAIDPVKEVETRDVETRLIASPPLALSNLQALKTPGGITGNKNPMLHDNIPRVIRWYKGRTTFEARKIHADFAWQSRFHDHIIRNERSYNTIHHYILNNPARWQEDKFC